MKITPLSIPDVLLIEQQVYHDQRGYFLESFNQARFEQHLGRPVYFVQDNHSHSVHKVLRGLHYQVGKPQSKLIRVTKGEVFDVAVDLRILPHLQEMDRRHSLRRKSSPAVDPGRLCPWLLRVVVYRQPALQGNRLLVPPR